MTPKERKMTIWMWSKGKDTFDIAKELRAERKRDNAVAAGPTEADVFAYVTDYISSEIEFEKHKVSA